MGSHLQDGLPVYLSRESILADCLSPQTIQPVFFTSNYSSAVSAFFKFLVERCSTFCCFGHGWPSRCALLEAEVLRAPSGAAEHLVLLAGRDGPQRVGHSASSRAPQGGQGQHWVNYE